jgi:hypothetical protein
MQGSGRGLIQGTFSEPTCGILNTKMFRILADKLVVPE